MLNLGGEQKRLNVTQQALAAKINDLRDELINSGVNIPFALKRRDPNEPGRTQKEKFEDQVFSVFMQQFRKQKKFVKDLLTRTFPGRKAIDDVSYLMSQLGDGFYINQEMIARLAKLLTGATKHGIKLFGESEVLQFDYTLTNTRAAKWASEFAAQEVKEIGETTRKSIRTIIKSFIDTPGMTIGDAVSLLPFDESRALMIATSEITDSYAEAALMSGKDLKKEFPDVLVIKTWFTNNDAIVQACPVCWPLHLQEVEIDEMFVNADLGLEFERPKAHPRGRCWMSTTTRIV